MKQGVNKYYSNRILSNEEIEAPSRALKFGLSLRKTDYTQVVFVL